MRCAQRFTGRFTGPVKAIKKTSTLKTPRTRTKRRVLAPVVGFVGLVNKMLIMAFRGTTPPAHEFYLGAAVVDLRTPLEKISIK